jgi:hypothetical protein
MVPLKRREAHQVDFTSDSRGWGNSRANRVRNSICETVTPFTHRNESSKAKTIAQTARTGLCLVTHVIAFSNPGSFSVLQSFILPIILESSRTSPKSTLSSSESVSLQSTQLDNFFSRTDFREIALSRKPQE